MKTSTEKSLFRLEDLRFMWWDKKLLGVFRWLKNECRYARQRIRRGYCDRDVWNLFDWFLNVIPDMLQQLKDTGTGYPCTAGTTVSRTIDVERFNRATGENRTIDKDEKEAFDQGLVAWQAILDRMIFLFREADENQCTKENPHQDAYDAASRDFCEKYGMFGEKLLKPEDVSSTGTRLYTPGDVDEYRPVWEQYMQEEQKIDQYRMDCKDEAFQLFSQWFYALWD